TMTPHIVRMPDITEDDVAPMWVGTQNNLTFRGVSPRIESQTSGDPFIQRPLPGQANDPDSIAVPGPTGPVTPNGRAVTPPPPTNGNAPTNPFNSNNPPNTQPPPNPEPQASNRVAPATSPAKVASMASTMSATTADLVSPSDIAALRMAPRVGP